MLTSLVSLQQGNVKKPRKLMKIVNFDGENLQSDFQGSCDLCYDNIKSHKKQDVTFSLEYIFLEKPQLDSPAFSG